MSKNVIKRHQIADYLNVGTSDTPSWVLMGAGFTAINESPGAQTETVKYVNDVSSSTSVVSYQTQFPFEAEHISTEEAIDLIYSIARNHNVGEDAETEYVRVELWRPVEDSTTLFTARKFTVSVEVSDVEGETKMELSGNLNAVGDPVDGYFDVSSKIFTALDDEEEENPLT